MTGRMENELQKQNITSLLAGDTNAADALFNQISEYGKKTVYDKAGLIEAQKTMMSFGLSSEKSFSTLKQIGDIAMGDANKMQSLALAFSQVTSAGKLQGQDLMNVMAVARARTAKQYHDFTSDPISNELYPNIKWLPSRSASPREVHRVFWNRVWAKNNPFWNSNTPGSLWNCKCDWEETDEPVTNGNPNGTMAAKGLEGNPARDGVIFTDECPYVKKGGGHSIVNGFYRDNLIETYKEIEKKTNILIKGEQKEVLINSIGVIETVEKRFGNPNYWLRNELLENIDKYLPYATYIGEESVDLSHNTGKTLKLKKNMSKAHKLQYNVGNKPFIITLFEYKDNGNLLFYYIEPPKK